MTDLPIYMIRNKLKKLIETYPDGSIFTAKDICSVMGVPMKRIVPILNSLNICTNIGKTDSTFVCHKNSRTYHVQINQYMKCRTHRKGVVA